MLRQTTTIYMKKSDKYKKQVKHRITVIEEWTFATNEISEC